MALIWNNKSNTEAGVVVEYFPDQPGPRRRMETVKVAGRNGDLLVDLGAWENYSQPYHIYFNAGNNGTPAAARAVRSWLQAPLGYCRLEDSYDPDVFRMAYYAGPADIENIMNRFGRATIRFTCKPQRFFKSGETPIKISSSGTVLVNHHFPSLPLIRVNGSSAGTLTIGNYTVRIDRLSSYIMLDSDLQDAYQGLQNKNSDIYAPEFPVLQPGENTIAWSGGITSLEITPRWWTI